MLICDTSGLLAYFDANNQHCSAVTAVINADPGPFVVPPSVIAELDYLLATRRSTEARLAALTELAGGAWDLAPMDATDLREATQTIDRYRDQDIGVSDASLVVLARRYRTDRLLTLDHRHFDVVRTADGKAFKVLP